MLFRGQTRGHEAGGTSGGDRDQGPVGKRTVVEQASVQLKPATPGAAPGGAPGEVAARGTSGTGDALPHRDKIQEAFGPAHNVSDIQARTGGAAADACDELGAEAYASGGQVGFRREPDLHTAAHEAAHVVQQRGGVQLKGGVGAAGDEHERHADAVADAVVAGTSAAPLLAQVGGDGAGGGAASNGVQLKPADFKTGAAIEAMTLTQFDAYARTQADWATGPAIGADKDKLWQLLEKARAEEAFLAGCGPMRVSGLIGAMADGKRLAALEQYCAAVHKDRPTVEIEPIADLNEAIKMGNALPPLEATPGGVTLKTIMKQETGNTQLQDMITAKAIDPFIKYVQTSHPVLQANNGAEISSYLAMKAEGVDPAAYKAKTPRVRNLHRFEKDALDALAGHETDTSKTKPLTLILHSAMDHNGAFHRDPNITKVAKHAKNVTIMVEGKETLADVQAEIDPLAKKYGQHDKVDQVMFAGHGAARIIELAGKVKDGKDRDGKDTVVADTDDVDLDNNQARTDALFAELMNHMDPASPNHRVIFNACLTNSNAVQGPLDPDPVKAQKQIKDAIAKDASLATTFKEKAKAMGKNIDSRGADGSIGQVGLINNATGALDLVSADDPYVTDAKIKYVEFGKEPEGVMRAVVEEWANDKKACLDAIARRQKAAAPKDWAGRLIHAMLDIVAASPDNANLMNELADGASAISEAIFEDECRVRRVKDAIPAGSRAKILGELAKTDDWRSYPYIPLVFYQVWSAIDASKAALFRDHLGANFTCHKAAKLVDVDFLIGAAVLDGLLPVPPPASPPAGELKLALIDVAQRRDKASVRAITYLQGVLGAERWFPARLGVAAKLDGLATENEILIAIDRAKPSAKTPDPNVDTDRDKKNDVYVEPMTRTGKVDVPSADVYEKADNTSKKLAALAKGTAVRVIGKASADWLAIEHNGGTAFAQVIDIAV
jgi:Domain of unknown function (DUF4157)